MAGTFLFASLYQSPTRLLVALGLMAMFGAVIPKRSPRPLAVALITVITAGWLFGATLIWGTFGPSKLRWGFELNIWQDWLLLGAAAGGSLAGAGALRCFAGNRRRAGWVLTPVFAVAFAAWSSVVRYSAIVALVVLAVGVAALVLASRPTSLAPSRPHVSLRTSCARWLSGVAVAALPFLSGYAFYWWLVISPKSWVDPGCGLPRWLPLTFIPFLAVPATAAWLRVRAVGRSKEGAVALAVVATALTIGAGILAFLVWFGLNRCGE
jgi:hypothetical protein